MRAIVIMYEGVEPTPYILDCFKETMKGIANIIIPVQFAVFDTEAIAEALVKDNLPNNGIVVHQGPSTEMVEGACKVFGETMARELTIPVNHVLLGCTMVKRVQMGDSDLYNAMTVLSDVDTVPKAMTKRYNITKEVINTIKQVYTSFQG